MRIGVTGGAGFVGATFVRQAVVAGHDVLNFDALTASATLADVWDLEDVPNYALVPGDITDRAALHDTMAQFRPDVIVHLAHAGPSTLTDDTASAYLQTNVLGVETVLDVAQTVGVGRVVLTHHHFPAQLKYTDKFVASKQAAFLVSQAFAAQSDIDVIHSFAPSVFGPRQSPIHPISLTIQRLLDGRSVVIPNGAEAAMELIFVDDYAAGLLLLCETGAADVNHLLAGPRQIRPLGIARQICNALQSHFPEADTQFSDLLDVRALATGEGKSKAGANGMDIMRGNFPYHKAITQTVTWQMTEGLANGHAVARRAFDQDETLTVSAA
ncbi:MAG: NAD-dependent epimerase/dehydratase family protein [Planktomarina sp.]